MELLSHRTPVLRNVVLALLTAAVGLLNACTSVREESAKWDPAGSGALNAPIVREEFMVPGADPGISLYVRNKRRASMNSFTQDNVVLFVHGATYPAETGFDLQLDGISWMDVLARQGFDVYLVNIRGYGKSTRPPEMDRPALQSKPVVNSDMAARDYAAAADWVRARRSVRKLNVIGHSWGTVITGLYTSRHSDKVQRLVLYAPVWSRQTNAALTDAGGELGAYRQVTIEQARQRKQAGLVPGRKPQPDQWFDAWAAATFETDPVGSKASPKFIRAPNGVAEDGRNYWNKGVPVYDPGLIKVPTLVVLGEWDADTPPFMAQTLFPLLQSAEPKKLVVLSGGTHSIMNETSRASLFDEVYRFLALTRRG